MKIWRVFNFIIRVRVYRSCLLLHRFCGTLGAWELQLPGVCRHCGYNTLPLFAPSHTPSFSLHATHHMAGLIVGRGLPELNQSEQDSQINVMSSSNGRPSCNTCVGVSSWRKLLSLVHTGLLLLALCCRWLDWGARSYAHGHTHTLMTVLMPKRHKQQRWRMKQSSKLKFSRAIYTQLNTQTTRKEEVRLLLCFLVVFREKNMGFLSTIVFS